jgi:hypothetical protein
MSMTATERDLICRLLRGLIKWDDEAGDELAIARSALRKLRSCPTAGC